MSDHPSLDEALLAVQRDVGELDLGTDMEAEKGSARFRRYLSYPKLLGQVRPLLTRNGVIWQTLPTTQDGEPALSYRLLHVGSGEAVEDRMKLMLDKQTSQAQGSGLTYAKRQALLAVLNLAPDKDDDGEAASQPARPEPVDPEKPMSETNVQSMLEAIAERSLSTPKVLERAGVKDGEVPTVEQGRKVKAILDAHDAGSA